jgi:hypothetical protein
MLTQAYPFDSLRALLIPRDQWHPHPNAAERDFWEDLPQVYRRGQIRLGEEALAFDWPLLPATLLLEYARTGNRTHYQDVRTARRNALQNLVIAECVEGKGRFVDQIVNGIWVTCEESFWGVPAHLRRQDGGEGLPDVSRPTVDLFAADTSSLFAWTTYLLKPELDSVSSLVVDRMLLEIDKRILTPNLEDEFHWMGFGNPGRRVNNWNPWINSNWLATTLLLEPDPERRLKSVARSIETLDKFIDPYPKDGGCDEGIGYWNRAGGALFDCLELLHSATDGEIDVYDDPLIQEMGKFAYRMQIGVDYFVNFADASTKVSPPASVIYRYGKRIGDENLVAFGAWAAGRQKLGKGGLKDGLGRTLATLEIIEELQSAKGDAPLPRDVWLPDTQVMTARREAGSTEGLFLAAKGGHNNESHNHNDIGNFIVYSDGRPVLVDAGVDDYTRKTFRDSRYEIWTMRSGYHSLPTINGILQKEGEKYSASEVEYSQKEDGATLRLDISRAYPTEAGVRSWVRAVDFVNGDRITVTDSYELEIANEICMSLLTPCDVIQEVPGRLDLKETDFGKGFVSGSAMVGYDSGMFEVTQEKVPIDGDRLTKVWGDCLTKITLTAMDPKLQDEWVLRIRGGMEKKG